MLGWLADLFAGGRVLASTRPKPAADVRTTIDLARNLGLDVVAEGVESQEILNDLSALSCDVAQGFFLSRPLPAADLDGWLAERAGATPSA